MRATLESAHPGTLPATWSFVDDGRGAVMVTARKGNEDISDGHTGLVVRAVETRGEAGEATINLGLLGRVLSASFGVSQIRTFRVPDDPAERITEVDLVEWALAGVGRSTCPPAG